MSFDIYNLDGRLKYYFIIDCLNLETHCNLQVIIHISRMLTPRSEYLTNGYLQFINLTFMALQGFLNGNLHKFPSRPDL